MATTTLKKINFFKTKSGADIILINNAKFWVIFIKKKNSILVWPPLTT